MADGKDLKQEILKRHTSLHGQTALVTGGTKGIGRQCVIELAAFGARVLTCSRSDEDLKKACAEWQAQGLDVWGFAADMSNTQGLESLIKEADRLFGGKLNILVNNAGTNVRSTTAEYKDEDYEKVISTNMDSAFKLTRLSYRLLKESGNASVIMMSSIAGGPLSISSGAPYGMSKAALDQLTKYLACEWAKFLQNAVILQDGIRVNSIKPGYIYTPLTENVLKDEKRMLLFRANTPMRRVGNPDEIAGLVTFLCTPSASYTTGQCISIDGGFSVCGLWSFEDVLPH